MGNVNSTQHNIKLLNHRQTMKIYTSLIITESKKNFKYYEFKDSFFMKVFCDQNAPQQNRPLSQMMYQFFCNLTSSTGVKIFRYEFLKEKKSSCMEKSDKSRGPWCLIQKKNRDPVLVSVPIHRILFTSRIKDVK